MNCPRCQTPCNPSARFCMACGAPLAPRAPVYPEWTPLPVETPGDSLAARIIAGGLIGGFAAAALLAVSIVAVLLLPDTVRAGPFTLRMPGRPHLGAAMLLAVPAGLLAGAAAGLLTGLIRNRKNRR